MKYFGNILQGSKRKKGPPSLVDSCDLNTGNKAQSLLDMFQSKKVLLPDIPVTRSKYRDLPARMSRVISLCYKCKSFPKAKFLHSTSLGSSSSSSEVRVLETIPPARHFSYWGAIPLKRYYVHRYMPGIQKEETGNPNHFLENGVQPIQTNGLESQATAKRKRSIKLFRSEKSKRTRLKQSKLFLKAQEMKTLCKSYKSCRLSSRRNCLACCISLDDSQKF